MSSADEPPRCRVHRRNTGLVPVRLDADQDTRERFLADVDRRLSLVGWLANTAGIVVIVAAVSFMLPVFLGDMDPTTGLWQLGVGAVAFVAAGFGLSWYGRRAQAAALGWIADGREPTEREHELTLRLATTEVLAAGAVWAVGSVLFGVLYWLTESASFGAIVLAGGWLGGETTCALYYLLLERALRPLTALTLDARLPERPV